MAQSPCSPPNATDDRGARILVVDDDATFGRSVARIVERHAAVAMVVGTVCAAMEQLADAATWNGFIFDVFLPDGSGLDVLARVRRHDGMVPALILTGVLDHDIANAAFGLGAEYLVKPVETTLIEQFLQRMHARVNDRYLETISCLASGAGAIGSTVHDRPEPMSLNRSSWEYVRRVVDASPTKAKAARSLGIAPRSLRRMLAKAPPRW